MKSEFSKTLKWVRDDYATKEQLNSLRERLQVTKATADGFIENAKRLLAEHSKHIAHLNTEIELKATKNETNQLVYDMKKFAHLSDYKELYDKVIPPLKRFELTINEFANDHAKMKEMIRNLDEAIAQKA